MQVHEMRARARHGASLAAPQKAPPRSSASASDKAADLSLLKGFQLRLDGEAVELPLSAQRLIAFLAIHNRPLQRSFVAGNLWLESSDVRAAANLRSALWRLHQHGRHLVDTRGGRLALAPHVRIDLNDIADQARQVLQASDIQPKPAADSGNYFELSLSGELLPDWYEDWILVERERFRQLRMHALETLCEQLTQAGKHAHAIEVGLAAVAAEPLRESAHRALIRCHLAEGNPTEALRQFRRYERVLDQELGVRPSPQMFELVAGLTPAVTPA